MTFVIVASKSKAKLRGIKMAFERWDFGDVKMMGIESESGVPDQPFGDDVLKGAMNRLEWLKSHSTRYADYYVACEGGVIEACGMYFNVQFTIIENSNGIIRSGMSQGFQIPTQYVQAVRSTGLASVMDCMFDGKGGVRVLSNGQMTRANLVEASTTLALGAFKW